MDYKKGICESCEKEKQVSYCDNVLAYAKGEEDCKQWLCDECAEQLYMDS